MKDGRNEDHSKRRTEVQKDRKIKEGRNELLRNKRKEGLKN